MSKVRFLVGLLCCFALVASMSAGFAQEKKKKMTKQEAW